jgi:hypothetical protein
MYCAYDSDAGFTHSSAAQMTRWNIHDMITVQHKDKIYISGLPQRIGSVFQGLNSYEDLLGEPGDKYNKATREIVHDTRMSGGRRR